ncbi:MAG: CoB--CoM heterodisulfide reductase subunit B [Methanomassiliicoccales archaeon]|jgi:heterodisulfide reductase subunit B|nr:CoB--CoM heterodisulfide reductase subunit B [Methanomassiliicoccales archaeon]
MTERYALFLGCIAPLRYPGIEKATREVFKALDVELVDLEGAGCCPAPGVIRSFDQTTWLALAARNLALAEKKGLDIITICNGCFGSLFDAAHLLHEDKQKVKEVNKILKEVGLEYVGDKIKVRHFADVLHKDIGIERIKSKVVNPLNFKAAVHYGCHFAKPSKIKQLDDPERPSILDELVEAVGPKSINYRDKMMCCGAGGGLRTRANEIAMKMTEEKLANVKKAGGQFIVDVCPFCHLQYDRTQKDVPGYNIPVIHLSQLYGLAFGLPRENMGFESHHVPVNL